MHLHNGLLKRFGLIKNTEIPNKPKPSLKHVTVHETHEDAQRALQVSINAEPETQ